MRQGVKCSCLMRLYPFLFFVAARVAASAAGGLGRRARPRQWRPCPRRKRVLSFVLWSCAPLCVRVLYIYIYIYILLFRERHKERRPTIIATKREREKSETRGANLAPGSKQAALVSLFLSSRHDRGAGSHADKGTRSTRVTERPPPQGAKWPRNMNKNGKNVLSLNRYVDVCLGSLAAFFVTTMEQA